MPPSYLLIIVCLVLLAGSAIIIWSFFALPKDDVLKWKEHRARTLATIGIAIASISIAVGAFYLKDRSDLEHERRTASLNFLKAMLQFGVSGRHMDYIRAYCDGRRPPFDRDGCQESGALAARFSGSLPTVDFTFAQVARGARSFSKTSRVATYLIEGEVALRGRMPISLDAGIRKLTASARPSSDLTVKLFALADTFQLKADEMSAIYCLFAETTSRSWAAFDEMIAQLEDNLGVITRPDDQLRLIRRRVKDLKVANVACEDVRAAIDDLLPVGGGNGSGGNGGGN